jgi:hypothetical protein
LLQSFLIGCLLVEELVLVGESLVSDASIILHFRWDSIWIGLLILIHFLIVLPSEASGSCGVVLLVAGESHPIYVDILTAVVLVLSNVEVLLNG